MKEKLTDELKDLLMQGKEWARLEVEYAKLTVAEKFTVLMSTMIIGAICLLMGVVVLIMLAFALVELFMLMMPAALAYLTVAGILCVLIGVIYLLRRPLMLNPIARFITKLFISK
ncbi:MAG: phage holin family protein [Muribaculaceae bacterium]|nr:phage holin family protein [Muribaculaceae bacterium]